MKLSEFKNYLNTVTELVFVKPNGTIVPKHFHITEIGHVNKRFIDCGGTLRKEDGVSMQLWESVDVWHRLKPSKLLDIIKLSEEKLGIEDWEIVVEHQDETIGSYGVVFKDGTFVLQPMHTNCLASDQCGIPSLKQVQEAATSCCAPGGKCC